MTLSGKKINTNYKKNTHEQQKKDSLPFPLMRKVAERSLAGLTRSLLFPVLLPASKGWGKKSGYESEFVRPPAIHRLSDSQFTHLQDGDDVCLAT